MHRYTEPPTLVGEPFLVLSRDPAGHYEARSVCVVATDYGPVAFYRSTGTGGETRCGQWVPFNGIADRRFIKLPAWKLPPGPLHVLSRALGEYFADLDTQQFSVVKEGSDHRTFCVALNQRLAALGAVHATGALFHRTVPAADAPYYIEPEKVTRYRAS